MIPKGTNAALVFEFDDLHRLAVDIDFQTSSGWSPIQSDLASALSMKLLGCPKGILLCFNLNASVDPLANWTVVRSALFHSCMSRAGRKPCVAPESVRSKPAEESIQRTDLHHLQHWACRWDPHKVFNSCVASWSNSAVLSFWAAWSPPVPPSPSPLITSVLPEPGLPVFNSLGEVVVESAEVAISLVLGLVGVILDGDVNVLDVAALDEWRFSVHIARTSLVSSWHFVPPPFTLHCTGFCDAVWNHNSSNEQLCRRCPPTNGSIYIVCQLGTV